MKAVQQSLPLFSSMQLFGNPWNRFHRKSWPQPVLLLDHFSGFIFCPFCSFCFFNLLLNKGKRKKKWFFNNDILILKAHFAMGTVKSLIFYFLLSAFLRNCFLCWDRWNSDLTPTLDAALLCSSRAGSDLGHEFGLVWGALQIIMYDVTIITGCA